jgi:hypothetical protein
MEEDGARHVGGHTVESTRGRQIERREGLWFAGYSAKLRCSGRAAFRPSFRGVGHSAENSKSIIGV